MSPHHIRGAVQALILAKKSEGQVHYDELTEKSPALWIRRTGLIPNQIVEDNGVLLLVMMGTNQINVREEEQLQADLALNLNRDFQAQGEDPVRGKILRKLECATLSAEEEINLGCS